MILLKTYVSNITDEKREEHDGIIRYKIVADTLCYSVEKKQKIIILAEDEYKSVKEKGYYMG